MARAKKLPRAFVALPQIPVALSYGVTGSTLRLDAVELKGQVGDDAGPLWSQLAVPGDYKTHSAGKFSLGAKAFSEMVANFVRYGRRPIPVNYEHQALRDDVVGPTPACGWIQDLRIATDGSLEGLIQWSDEARALVRAGMANNGGYKWISPEIVFGAKDSQTADDIGAKLIGAGVTNYPYLNLQPLAAKATTLTVTDKLVATLREVLRMPDEATAAQVFANASYLCQCFDRGLSIAGVSELEMATKMRDALGLSVMSTISWSQLREAVAHVAASTQTNEAAASPSASAGNDFERDSHTMDHIDKLQAANTELTANLKVAETHVASAKAEVATKDAEIKALKDDSAKKAAELAAKDAEIKALKDDNEKLAAAAKAQAEKDVNHTVDLAIMSYGESKGLKNVDREILMTYAR
jgi:hypothetical protein